MEGKHALVVDNINKLLASSNAKQKVRSSAALLADCHQLLLLC
jgi:hypothetical protein